jgi:hypothetical protein
MVGGIDRVLGEERRCFQGIGQLSWGTIPDWPDTELPKASRYSRGGIPGGPPDAPRAKGAGGSPGCASPVRLRPWPGSLAGCQGRAYSPRLQRSTWPRVRPRPTASAVRDRPTGIEARPGYGRRGRR